MTPYKAAKIVNESLKSVGIDKKIPPQMMYNYCKKSVGFKSYKNDSGKIEIDESSFKTWLEKYINDQIQKSGRKNEEFYSNL